MLSAVRKSSHKIFSYQLGVCTWDTQSFNSLVCHKPIHTNYRLTSTSPVDPPRRPLEFYLVPRAAVVWIPGCCEAVCCNGGQDDAWPWTHHYQNLSLLSHGGITGSNDSSSRLRSRRLASLITQLLTRLMQTASDAAYRRWVKL